MKKAIIAGLTLTMALSFATPASAAKTPHVPKGFYPTMGQVTKVTKLKGIDRWKVTFRDGVGRKYSWKTEDCDWHKGDFVATIMWDKGTPRNVYDDHVVEARYVGYLDLFN